MVQEVVTCRLQETQRFCSCFYLHLYTWEIYSSLLPHIWCNTRCPPDSTRPRGSRWAVNLLWAGLQRCNQSWHVTMSITDTQSSFSPQVNTGNHCSCTFSQRAQCFQAKRSQINPPCCKTDWHWHRTSTSGWLMCQLYMALQLCFPHSDRTSNKHRNVGKNLVTNTGCCPVNNEPGGSERRRILHFLETCLCVVVNNRMWNWVLQTIMAWRMSVAVTHRTRRCLRAEKSDLVMTVRLFPFRSLENRGDRKKSNLTNWHLLAGLLNNLRTDLGFKSCLHRSIKLKKSSS